MIKKYTDKNLNQLRSMADMLSDKAAIDFINNPEMVDILNNAGQLSQVYSKDFTLAIQEFFSFYQKPPSFIETDKIKLAQDFFQTNGNLYLTLLGLYSLPYCYAFADGAQVLYRSKRITSDIGNRLAETALFVLDSFKPNTFIQDDTALLTLVKVRLIHSYARFFIHKHSKDWDQSWGLPINQEDLMGTNLAFSLLVVRGLTKLGKYPGVEVYESILHYWKVIGWYLGVNIDYWPNSAKEAYELEYLIRKRQLKPSVEGQFLLANLKNYFLKELDGVGSHNEIDSILSFFLGEEVSKVLNIKYQSILSPTLTGIFFNLNFYKNQKQSTNYTDLKNEFNKRFKGNVKLNLPTFRS
jgi:hypothetical protein